MGGRMEPATEETLRKMIADRDRTIERLRQELEAMRSKQGSNGESAHGADELLEDTPFEEAWRPMEPSERPTFPAALRDLINIYSRDADLELADFIVADYIVGCMENLKAALEASRRLGAP